MNSDPTPLVGPADLPVQLSFTLAQCNMIRQLVGTGPHDQVNPIVAALEGQVQSALRAYHTNLNAPNDQPELPLEKVTDAA